MAYLGFDKEGGPHPGVWGTEVPQRGLGLCPSRQWFLCDFETNSKHLTEAPFNGYENTKLASNIGYTGSGVIRIQLVKGGKLRGSGGLVRGTEDPSVVQG